MKTLTIIGGVLLVISIYPIWRFVEIVEEGRAANAQYEFLPIFENNRVEFHGHTVKLADEIGEADYGEHDRRISPVTIWIDDKNFSTNHPAIIRPKFHDDNRYFNWVSVVQLRDKDTGKFSLAIVQRTGDLLEDAFGDLSKVKFRILYVSESGDVTEETFSYSDRKKIPYRSPLVTYVSREVEMYFPNLVVPVLFPVTSTVLGISLLAIGLNSWIGARKNRMQQ